MKALPPLTLSELEMRAKKAEVGAMIVDHRQTCVAACKKLCRSIPRLFPVC